MVLWGA